MGEPELVGTEPVPPVSVRRRLWALDGLRGLAALAVVAYHYLHRGPELYPELGTSYPWLDLGQYGVQLFFIISGFVIFDSARKDATKRFFVNRAIRLYPAYWVAVILTFTVVAVFGLRGREVSVPAGLFNLTMLERFFNVPYVDGAYWTLAVELSFYVAIGLLARTAALLDRRIFVTLFIWLLVDLAVRGVDFLTSGNFVIEMLGGIAYWMPLFLVGIALNIGHRTGKWLLPAMVIGAALCVIAPGDLSVVPILAATTALTLGTLYVKLPDRVRPISDYLGELSYPIYLVHQNIGYVIMLALIAAGIPQFGSVTIAAGAAILVATTIAYGVDRPVRKRLRDRIA